MLFFFFFFFNDTATTEIYTLSLHDALPISCLAVCLARDELVRDVDVPRVAAEPVRAQAGGMAQLRGRLGLALGPHGRLALARDDLQRDVEARPLVAGEPHRARAAAAERPQGPVAVEDELDAGERRGSLYHA